MTADIDEARGDGQDAVDAFPALVSGTESYCTSLGHARNSKRICVRNSVGLKVTLMRVMSPGPMMAWAHNLPGAATYPHARFCLQVLCPYGIACCSSCLYGIVSTVLATPTSSASSTASTRYSSYPQRALCRGIPSSFLEPSLRSWSHFVGIYRQKLTRSVKN